MSSRVVGVCLLVFVAATATPAAEETAAEDAARRVAELRAELDAVRTVRDLDLDLAQARAVLDLAHQAASARIVFEARRAEILREQQSAFLRFLAEDVQDRGFTPEVEHAAALANAKEEAVALDFYRRVNALEARLAEILDPEQTGSVGAAPGSILARGPRATPLIERAEATLAALRALPALDWRRRGRDLCNEALVHLGARGDKDRGAQVDALVAAVEAYRAASPEALPGLRDGIWQRFFPPVRADQIRRELARIHRDKKGGVGRSGAWLANRATVPALAALVARLEARSKNKRAQDRAAAALEQEVER